MNLVIDIGNTKVKAAVFELDTIKVAYVFDEIYFFNQLEDILEKHEITHCILSSVKETREDYIQKLKKIPFFIVLDSSTKVPFKNLF
ncbi:type III pantothenate kinase [Flavobacteriaceae bacterium]|nr:type III pantothenate kinase [Flavobacteriaceae bacterium]